MRRRDFIGVMAGTIAAWPMSARAQTYPSKVIKIIVPFTPGSPVDAAARVVTQQLQTRIGQSVVIENRPGAGTVIGTKAVATAAPDGYTLLLTGTQLVYIPVLYPSIDVDVVKSLVPIAPLVVWSHVIVVAPSVPAATLAELVAYAKANPGTLVFGFGQGTAPQILGESFKRAAGIEMTMIPYRGGEQARADLLGGRVHLNMAPTASLLALIQEGKVRPLAFTGPTRSPDLPDVPTTVESGFPSVGYNPDVWLGLLAPPGTPAAVVEKINTVVNDSLRSPAMMAALTKLGFEPKSATPQEFAIFLAAETQKWPPLLAAAGVKAE
jgi:tripartite-type tricarboxylate transporter receptor subunit TctC